MQRNQICTQKLQKWIQIGAYRQYCMAWRGLCKLRAKFQGQEKGKKGKREKGKKGKREDGSPHIDSQGFLFRFLLHFKVLCI